jgi:hypothetical protein
MEGSAGLWQRSRNIVPPSWVPMCARRDAKPSRHLVAHPFEAREACLNVLQELVDRAAVDRLGHGKLPWRCGSILRGCPRPPRQPFPPAIEGSGFAVAAADRLVEVGEDLGGAQRERQAFGIAQDRRVAHQVFLDDRLQNRGGGQRFAAAEAAGLRTLAPSRSSARSGRSRRLALVSARVKVVLLLPGRSECRMACRHTIPPADIRWRSEMAEIRRFRRSG